MLTFKRVLYISTRAEITVPRGYWRGWRFCLKAAGYKEQPHWGNQGPSGRLSVRHVHNFQDSDHLMECLNPGSEKAHPEHARAMSKLGQHDFQRQVQKVHQSRYTKYLFIFGVYIECHDARFPSDQLGLNQAWPTNGGGAA